MFGPKKRKGKKSGDLRDIGNVPPTAYDAAKAEWAERNGDPTVNASRYFVIAAIAMVIIVLMAGALNGLTPLKSVVAYEISFNRDTGETTPRKITTENFKPDEVQKRYFLAQWVSQMLTLDPFTTERDLSLAYGMVRGKAIDEFKDFMRSTQPVARLQQDNSLTRTVRISSLQFLSETVAQARVVTQERTVAAAQPPRRYILTIHFAIDPPKTEREMYENPIGIRITHFAIAEELQ